MLVLSRKLKEKIVVPTVGITIQVVEIKGGVVRLGIDAPPEVTVLREEVPDRASEWAEERTRPEHSATGEGDQVEFVRQVHDRLKTTGVGLGLLRLQFDIGQAKEAKATLAGLQDDFQEILHGVEGEIVNSPVTPPNKVCKSHKALLVEDETDERELLAVFLRRSGLDVDTAGNGVDALDYLHSHGKPDVMLLDMGQPRVDGPTLVREIRGDCAYAGLKIFGVSTHSPDEFDLQLGPNGIDRWFKKPLDPTAFLHDLTEELDSSLCCV